MYKGERRVCTLPEGTGKASKLEIIFEWILKYINKCALNRKESEDKIHFPCLQVSYSSLCFILPVILCHHLSKIR